jgi:hypothetical protein
MTVVTQMTRAAGTERPDLEIRLPLSATHIWLENKLDAPFTDAQQGGYRETVGPDGKVILLLPAERLHEAVHPAFIPVPWTEVARARDGAASLMVALRVWGGSVRRPQRRKSTTDWSSG